MSSSEQGNRQGAAPPRVAGAATAAAAAGRAPLTTAGPNGAVTTTYGSATRTEGPSVSVNRPSSSGATGGEWVSSPAGTSTAPPPSPGAGSRPVPPPVRPGVGPSPMYPAAAGGGGARSVRLTVASLDPWSVLKLSFLLSVAIGIAMVVAGVVLWSVLNGMGVFDQINRVLLDITGTEGKFNIYDYVGLGRVVSLTTVLGVVNVVLMTALSTLGAFLYNLGSGLVGGLHVTLTDD